ncbi:MAG: phosphoribosylglycinamide formyltransferase [Deltaproteobacteria bacterium]|nr:phosphoribosylglycinamide formyltransferase [Deltaproteobacteria bacterium]
MSTLDLGVLISGRGTNLQSILDAVSAGELDARVRLVASNRPGAAGLERARRAGVPTEVVPSRGFADRQAFDAALARVLQDAGARWIVLAGFMRILSGTFLAAFPHRVLNIHPALCPAFPGVDAQAQALAHGVRVTGCTVHLVDEGVDTGPILAQALVPVLQGDSRESLAARLLVREHELLVTVLRWIAQDRLRLEPPAAPGGRARVLLRGVFPVLGLDPSWREVPAGGRAGLSHGPTGRDRV